MILDIQNLPPIPSLKEFKALAVETSSMYIPSDDGLYYSTKWTNRKDCHVFFFCKDGKYHRETGPSKFFFDFDGTLRHAEYFLNQKLFIKPDDYWNHSLVQRHKLKRILLNE